MRIFFIGTVDYSLFCLEKLVSMNADIVGVGTKKDTGFNADYADLCHFSGVNDIPCQYFDDINTEESIGIIKSFNPDIIFCFGWNSLLKAAVLKISPMGVLGHHPAPLPLNRGRHPLIWSIVLGLKKAASTFFFMDEGVDSGEIVLQDPFEIRHEDTAGDVYARMEQTISKQLERLLPCLSTGNYKSIPQDETLANVWRKRSVPDGEIDFRMHSEDIYNLVRGLTHPYVGSHVRQGNRLIKVWRVEVAECDIQNIEPGKIIDSSGDTFTVKTFGGAIRIIDHEFSLIPKPGEYL